MVAVKDKSFSLKQKKKKVKNTEIWKHGLEVPTQFKPLKEKTNQKGLKIQIKRGQAFTQDIGHLRASGV